MPTSQGPGLNCFGLICRDNTLHFETTTRSIDSSFIIEQLDRLSTNLGKETIVVFDNAKPHTAQAVQKCRPIWRRRGLTLFYLPPYSPHLNLAETLLERAKPGPLGLVRRKLKYQWLSPQDYLSFEHLRYAVQLALAAVGSRLNITFSKPKLGLG